MRLRRADDADFRRIWRGNIRDESAGPLQQALVLGAQNGFADVAASSRSPYVVQVPPPSFVPACGLIICCAQRSPHRRPDISIARAAADVPAKILRDFLRIRM